MNRSGGGGGVDGAGDDDTLKRLIVFLFFFISLGFFVFSSVKTSCKFIGYQLLL